MGNKATIYRSYSTFGGWTGEIVPEEGEPRGRGCTVLEPTLGEAKRYVERFAGQKLVWRRVKTWNENVPKSQQEPSIDYVAEW